MSKSWLARAMLAGLTGVGLASCTLISGVGDLEAVDALDAATPINTADANRSEGGGNGGGDQDTGMTDSGALSDAPLIGDPDATVIEACSPSGCLPFPSNFQLVAYATGSAACPSGYGNPTTAVTNPAVAAGACSCQCTVTNAGNCAQTAPIPSSYGDTASGITCPTAADTYTGNQDRCGVDGYLGPFASTSTIAFFPPKAGPFNAKDCTPSAKSDPTKVTSTPVRICSANVIPKCEDKVCAGDPGGGYQACVASNGDLACPDATMVKHLVGSSPTVSCNGSACKCGGLQAQCKGSGKLELFAAQNCVGAPGLTLTADGDCRVAPDNSTVWTSHRFTADPPQNAFCPPSGSATPSAVSMSQLLTVCCTK